jgi:hypothetical protein
MDTIHPAASLPGIFSLGSLILSIALAVLCWYFNKSHGLGNDDGSTRLLVGWRYTHTIIAVFLTQAVVQTVEDVKRTEAFARPWPARSRFGRALLYSTFLGCGGIAYSKASRGSEGVATKDGFWPGHLLLPVSASSVSLLFRLPFSRRKEISIRQTVPLQRYTASNTPLPIELKPRRDTYFHTISGFLFNASTSMWVSDSYVVLHDGHTQCDPEGQI